MLHTGQLHGFSICDFGSKMISLAIHTENVLALETKEVAIEISFVANLTHGSLSLANRLSLSVNEVLIEVIKQKFV